MAVPTSTKGRDDAFVIEGAKVMAKTDKAILVEAEFLEGLDDDVRWFPFSQIDDDSEIWGKSEKGEVGDLVITKWIAEKKGLI